jgi:RNA polymerase sigma-70 factor (ECF subfamily)
MSQKTRDFLFIDFFFSFFCNKNDVGVSIEGMKTEMEIIVTGCQRGLSTAQKMLYDRFAPMMLGVCMRYTHSRDEAQDLLHDGFIKAFESIGRLQNANSVESWLYKIMVNVSINYVTRNRQIQYTDMATLENQEDLVASMDETPIENDHYTMDQIVRAIQELPEQFRVVFNMHEVEEMEYSEIAEQLGIQESTVRSHFSRARRMLREKLSNIKSE